MTPSAYSGRGLEQLRAMDTNGGQLGAASSAGVEDGLLANMPGACLAGVANVGVGLVGLMMSRDWPRFLAVPLASLSSAAIVLGAIAFVLGGWISIGRALHRYRTAVHGESCGAAPRPGVEES